MSLAAPPPTIRRVARLLVMVLSVAAMLASLTPVTARAQAQDAQTPTTQTPVTQVQNGQVQNEQPAQAEETSVVSAVPRAQVPGGPSGEAAAWMLVDADTGIIIAANNIHERLGPASTIKLLTALIALERLPENDEILTSVRAESMPARKMNMLAGEVWDLEDSLHNMLIVSANDAAVAVAERIGGGSLDGWQTIAEETGDRLGMVDDPILADPSGLDDEFSNKGGSKISAHDLAIAARAAFARPEIVQIINKRRHEYESGGDGEPHSLINRNLLPDLYEGALGGKTGFTERSGRSLVGLAKRGDRTMIALTIDAVDTYGTVTTLFDRGFATNPGVETRWGRLPDVVPMASVEPVTAIDAAEGEGDRDAIVGETVAAEAAGGTGGEPVEPEQLVGDATAPSGIEYGGPGTGIRADDLGQVPASLTEGSEGGGETSEPEGGATSVQSSATDEGGQSDGPGLFRRVLLVLLGILTALAVAIGLRRRHVVKRRANARLARQAEHRRRAVDGLEQPPTRPGVASEPVPRMRRPTTAQRKRAAARHARRQQVIQARSDAGFADDPIPNSEHPDQLVDDVASAVDDADVDDVDVAEDPPEVTVDYDDDGAATPTGQANDRPSAAPGTEPRRTRPASRTDRTSRTDRSRGDGQPSDPRRGRGSKRDRRSRRELLTRSIASRSGLDRPFRLKSPPPEHPSV